MSRHVVRQCGAVSTVVGYDNPLSTFFFQKVVDGEEVEGNEMFPGEIETIDGLQSAMDAKGLGVTLDVTIREKLKEDKANASGPSPLQKRMIAMFNNQPANKAGMKAVMS